MTDISTTLTPSEWQAAAINHLDHPEPQLTEILSGITEMPPSRTCPEREVRLEQLTYALYIQIIVNSKNAARAGQVLREKPFETQGAALLHDLIDTTLGVQPDTRKAMIIRMAAINNVPPDQYGKWLSGIKDRKKALRDFRNLIRKDLKRYLASKNDA